MWYIFRDRIFEECLELSFLSAQTLRIEMLQALLECRTPRGAYSSRCDQAKDAISGFAEKQLRLVQVRLTAVILNARQLDEGACFRPRRVKCAFARPERWKMMELDLFLSPLVGKSANLKFLFGPVVILSCCSAARKESCDTGPHQGSNDSLNLLENEETVHVKNIRA